jgi:hypothetical protein
MQYEDAGRENADVPGSRRAGLLASAARVACLSEMPVPMATEAVLAVQPSSQLHEAGEQAASASRKFPGPAKSTRANDMDYCPADHGAAVPPFSHFSGRPAPGIPQLLLAIGKAGADWRSKMELYESLAGMLVDVSSGPDICANTDRIVATLLDGIGALH